MVDLAADLLLAAALLSLLADVLAFGSLIAEPDGRPVVEKPVMSEPVAEKSDDPVNDPPGKSLSESSENPEV